MHLIDCLLLHVTQLTTKNNTKTIVHRGSRLPVESRINKNTIAS